MSDLMMTWKTAKTAWNKKGSKTVPHEIEMQMIAGGWDTGDLSKKLAAVDKATKPLAKTKAWGKAEAVVTRYQQVIAMAAASKEVGKAGKKSLSALATALDTVTAGAWALAIVAPTKPSGRSETVTLVSKRNAASGLRPKWLEVGALDVTAYLVVDAEVLRLEKEGLLGWHWKNLQSDANAVVERTVKDFVATIRSLDRSIGAEHGEARNKKVVEANEALRHYAGLVELQVNEVVDDYWARARKRQAYLKSFKTEMKLEFAVTALTIAVSAVSLGFSLGAAAPAWAAIAKTTVEAGFNLEKLERSARTVRKTLDKRIGEIEKQWNQRVKAKASGSGQKAAKSRQVAKEAAASALGGLSTKLMTTTSRTGKEAKEYLGKLTEMEEQAATMLAALDEFTSSFPSAPEGPDARTSKAIAGVYNDFRAMNLRAIEFGEALREDIAWGENVVELCEKLGNEDYVPKWTKTAGTSTKVALALFAVVKATAAGMAKLA